MCMKRARPQSLDEAMNAGKQDPNFRQNFVNTIINQRDQCGIMSKVDENYAQMLHKPLQQNVWQQLPWNLTKKILLGHFTDTFTARDMPATVEKHITTMSSLHNKEITAYVHSPQATLTILGNICGTLPPQRLAERINTTGMRNYLELNSSQ